jgi:chorismate synthase
VFDVDAFFIDFSFDLGDNYHHHCDSFSSRSGINEQGISIRFKTKDQTTMRTISLHILFLFSSKASVNGLQLTMGTGNTFGRVFRISTWGESHGGGVGVTLDGCPPRISITREEIQRDLDRRRPGQSRITTPRDEPDAVEILSGMSPDGVTLGTPIAMLVRNKDQRSSDYLDNDMNVAYRPSHADATYDAKYGVRAIAGGGRSSARETIGRVAAGAIARKILQQHSGIEILAYVSKVQDIECSNVDDDTFTMEDVDSNMVRCPDAESAERMLERIDEIRKSGNSIGGVVTCVARNVPAGLGSPVFDKLEAELAKACMSIPAAKGFESGSGFKGTLLTGKEHNDEFYIDPVTGATRTKTNRSGGIQGGISNGENIVVRVAFKPTSTIGQEQASTFIR